MQYWLTKLLHLYVLSLLLLMCVLITVYREEGNRKDALHAILRVFVPFFFMDRIMTLEENFGREIAERKWSGWTI